MVIQHFLECYLCEENSFIKNCNNYKNLLLIFFYIYTLGKSSYHFAHRASRKDIGKKLLGASFFSGGG
jgi:hypothetical protein